jgi:DNA replication protein DnaC
LRRRKELQEIRGSEPTPLAQVTIPDPDPEQGYWLAISQGKKPFAQALETKRDLWDSFDSDRHPKLKQAALTVKKWYNERIECGGALILAGWYGCGKSHLAKAIHQLYGHHSCFWYEPDLFGAIRDTYGAGSESEYKLFKQIRSHKLLILDDLGSYEVDEDSIKFVRRVYQMLLNDRYELGKATLITTNLDDDSGRLEGRLGERCYDRLIGALELPEFYINLFDVPSYRRRNF